MTSHQPLANSTYSSVDRQPISFCTAYTVSTGSVTQPCLYYTKQFVSLAQPVLIQLCSLSHSSNRQSVLSMYPCPPEISGIQQAGDSRQCAQSQQEIRCLKQSQLFYSLENKPQLEIAAIIQEENTKHKQNEYEMFWHFPTLLISYDL